MTTNITLPPGSKPTPAPQPDGAQACSYHVPLPAVYGMNPDNEDQMILQAVICLQCGMVLEPEQTLIKDIAKNAIKK